MSSRLTCRPKSPNVRPKTDCPSGSGPSSVCGHHYARSLSAWGLLIAASGVQYDGIARTLSFDPIADGRYPFTTGTAWGVATIAGDE